MIELAEKTKFLYKTGAITRREAKEMIKPFEEAFNRKSKEIAKKYNVKAKLFNFNAYMR